MTRIWKFLLVISLSAVAVACTGGHSPPRQTHDERAADPTLSSGAGGDHDQDLLAIKEHLDRLLKTSDATEFLQKAEKTYFSTHLWKNKVSVTSTFHQFLDRVHETLLSIPVEKRWKGLSDFYDGFCDDDFKNCELLLVLKNSPKSAQLLQQLGESLPAVEKKFKFLFMSLDVQNQLFPQETLQAVIQDLSSYRDFLVKEKKTALLDRLNRFLSLLLSYYNEGKIKLKDPSWISKLSLLQSQNMDALQIAGSTRALQDVTQAIQKSQEGEESFQKKMKWIDAFNPTLKTRLGLLEIPLEKPFFVIDQIFTSRWDPKQAQAFSEASKIPIAELAQMAELYLRAEIIYIIALSQHALSELAKKLDQFKAQELFTEAQKSLYRSSTQAKNLPLKAQALSQFISLLGPRSEESEKVRGLVAKINQTLKVAVVNPATLALFDLASKLGLKLSDMLDVPDYAAEPSLPLDAYLQRFFQGRLRPILDFTNESSPTPFFEIGESLELAARSGTFEILKSSFDGAMANLFDLYMQTDVDENPLGRLQTKLSLIDRSMENLNKKYAPAEWEDLKHKCLALSRPSKAGHAVQAMTIDDIRISPTLGKAAHRLSSPMNEFDESHGYFHMNQMMADQLERLRLDVLPTLQFFSVLKESLETSGQNIPLPQLSKRLQHAKDRSKNFLLALKMRFDEADSCYFTLLNAEKKIMSQVIAYEHEYWKWAYSHWQNQKTDPAIFSSVIPPELAYRTQFHEQMADLSPFDLYFRLKFYFRKGFPPLNLPPLAPNIDFQIPSALESSSTYRGEKKITLPFAESKEEFARNATRASLMGKAGDDIYSLSWFQRQDNLLMNFQDYWDGIVLFHRLSPLASKVLGIPFEFPVEILFQKSNQVHSFVGLDSSEQKLFPLLRIQGRQTLESFVATRFYNDSRQPAPAYDYLLIAMAQKSVRTFARSVTNENHIGSTLSLPFSIVPVPKLARMLRQYEKERQNHFFSGALKVPQKLIQNFQNIIDTDRKLQLNFAAEVTKQPAFEISFFTDQKIRLDPYTPSILDQLKATTEER